MMARFSIRIWVSLLCLVAATSATAERCPERTVDRLPVHVQLPPRFWADVCYFAESPETYRIEVFVSLVNDDLQFIKRKGRYVAHYDLTVIANDRRGRQVTGDQIRRTRWADTYEETSETGPSPVERIVLKLPTGEYRIEILARDVDSGMESKGEQRIVLAAHGRDNPRFSSFKFLAATDSVGQMLTGSEAVWVDRAYGDSPAVVRVYMDLYGADPDAGSLDVSYEVVDVENEVVADGRCRWTGDHSLGKSYVFEQPVDSLSLGGYELRVIARSDGDELASMCGRFRITSSQALWGRDFEKTRELLSYIATGEELDALKDAPPEKRREAWEEFWSERDPSPRTDRNETREVFFERVDYANRHFSEMLAEGWQTDRGRIYITEGPPDSIESHPMDASYPDAWEAWHYYSRSVTYIFVDRSGFGQYVLVGVR